MCECRVHAARGTATVGNLEKLTLLLGVYDHLALACRDGRVVASEGGTVSAAVFFVEPSQFDFDAEENETIIDRCKKKAFAWISYLPYSLDVELVDVTRTSRVYDRYDDILTGFGILAEIKEAVGWSQCESQVCPTDFNSDFNADFGGRCYNPIYNN